MPAYILDTNVYLQATRDDEWNRQLVAFYTRRAPQVHLHSVVAGELLAGAIRRGLDQKTDRCFLLPFETVGRVVTPSHAAWKRAGRLVARLVRRGALSPNGVPRSFFNDCLIAATSREHGFVLVTNNIGDFKLIGSVEPFRFVSPWP